MSVQIEVLHLYIDMQITDPTDVSNYYIALKVLSTMLKGWNIKEKKHKAKAVAVVATFILFFVESLSGVTLQAQSLMKKIFIFTEN